VDGLEAVLLRGRLMSEPYLDLRLGELLESVTQRGGPGAGAIAALNAAAAAALVELAARATELEQWPEAAGAAAQARRLRERLVPLAREDAEAYQAAVAQLQERHDDFALGEALARAADIPLEIADHAENVSALAAEAAAHANPDLRADAAAAAALALGAAWAAAKLVEVNLAMQSEDPRLARARKIAAGATRTAREALTVDE
jgi:methenyltetrahydrofolate cyclohydrolase